MIEFAQKLKDADWLEKQDPYVIIKCGNQMLRTCTQTDGGKSPVWNETFTFNVINENSAELTIMDEDTMSADDTIGSAVVPFAKAREQGTCTIQSPVITKKGKQHGMIQVVMTFVPNDSLKPKKGKKAVYPPAPYPHVCIVFIYI
jgi:Ca2+-dependent lipid-binding protein